MNGDKTVQLTPEQDKAIASLERALSKCVKAGLYLWDDYGTISAVDGNNVSSLDITETDSPLDRDKVSILICPAWHGSNADDPLYVRWK